MNDLIFVMSYYHKELLDELFTDDDRINEFDESRFVQNLCKEYIENKWDNEDLSLIESTRAFLKAKIDNRVCNECGKTIKKGFCIHGGEEYYCSLGCLHKHYTEEEYNRMYEEDEETYWTEWEE